jgi:hypothetical protein
LIAIYVLVTLLLIWAAWVDIRTRQIPVIAGYGILTLGLIVLLLNQLWIEAVYYALAIWCTSGGVWKTVLSIASLILVFIRGEEVIPLVLGVLIVAIFFWMNRFGGGDSQLAIGLIGVGHDWPVLAFLAGTTILAWLIIVFRKHGITSGLKRMAFVFQRIDEQADADAIRTPWAVIALIGGTLYLWVWPYLIGVG